MRAQLAAALPESLLRDPGVSYGAKITYARLRLFGAGGNGAFPSYDTLATALGAAPSTVKRWAKELRDVGLLAWQNRIHTPGRRPTSNLYGATKTAAMLERKSSWLLWIPVAVLERGDLPPGAKLVYASLLRMAGGGLAGRSSLRKLAKTTCFPERSLRRWLKQIERAGLAVVLAQTSMEKLYAFPAWDGMTIHLREDLVLHSPAEALEDARRNETWPPPGSDEDEARNGQKESPFKMVHSEEEERASLSRDARPLAPEERGVGREPDRELGLTQEPQTFVLEEERGHVRSRPAHTRTRAPGLRRLERRWFELLEQEGFDLERGFSDKERAQVSLLVRKYSAEIVELSFLYVLRFWDRIRERMFTRTPSIYPSVGLILQTHDRLVVEAQLWRATWMAVERMHTPSDDYKPDPVAYGEAIKMLTALGLSEDDTPYGWRVGGV